MFSNKKVKKEPSSSKLKQEQITDHMSVVKPKRKINRFNGMPEEEVILKTLPDHLVPGLDIVIVSFHSSCEAMILSHAKANQHDLCVKSKVYLLMVFNISLVWCCCKPKTKTISLKQIAQVLISKQHDNIFCH